MRVLLTSRFAAVRLQAACRRFLVLRAARVRSAAASRVSNSVRRWLAATGRLEAIRVAEAAAVRIQRAAHVFVTRLRTAAAATRIILAARNRLAVLHAIRRARMVTTMQARTPRIVAVNGSLPFLR